MEDDKAKRRRQSKAKWVAANPDYFKQWRATNGESQSLKNSEYKRRKRFEAREKIFALLGGPVCARCGYNTDQRALQIDHIDGGGHQHRKRSGSPDAYYREIIACSAVGYQVLCANCNHIKRYEMEEVTPRKIKRSS